MQIVDKCQWCGGKLGFYPGNCCEPGQVKCVACSRIHWEEIREPLEIVQRGISRAGKKKDKKWMNPE